jgi:hypothetical protein
MNETGSETWQQPAGRIQLKVRRGRMRHLTVLLIEEATPVLAILLCLRIGQVAFGVHFGWIALCLGAVALAVVLGALSWRVRRRLHTPYEIAQMLDAGSRLNDSFSTAWFLLANPGYATGPNVVAHIAHAGSRVSEIKLRELFPLPVRRIFVVLSLGAVLAAIGVVSPRAGSQTSLSALPWRVVPRDSLKAIAAPRIDQGGARSPENLKTGLPNRLGIGDEPGDNPVGRQVTESREMGDSARSRSTLSSGDPLPGKTGAEKGRDAVNETMSSPSTASPSDSGSMRRDANQSASSTGSHQDRTENGNFSSPAPSLLSRVLSSMKRLLNVEGKGGHSTEADTQTVSKSVPAPKTSVASGRLQALPQGSISNQQGVLPDKPEYSAADASTQQTSTKAPGSLPASMGGAQPAAAPNPTDKYSLSDNVIDLVDASPDGEAGQARVLAARNSASGPPRRSSDFAHHADFGGQIRHDDVPLAYQGAIQAYLEHAPESAGR